MRLLFADWFGVELGFADRVRSVCGDRWCANPAHMEHHKRPRVDLPDLRGVELARFEAKFDRGPADDSCWQWNAAKLDSGYGVFGVRKRVFLAHRVAFRLANGRDPREVVRHECNNPSCVNPSHLSDGTMQDNADDTVRSGRIGPRGGEASPNAKLTDAAVREIRRRYRSGGVKQSELAAEFGVVAQRISDIVCGRSWTHVA